MISKRILFEKVRDLCNSGWHNLASRSTGAAGNYLEEKLGLKTTNHDGPDAGLWELKFSSSVALVTLFHKTPRPDNCIKDLIETFGYVGSNGRPSFRHTIQGHSGRGFIITHDSESICVMHEDSDAVVTYWTEDDLLNAAGRKLTRLLFVTGRVRTHGGQRQVTYEGAIALSDFKISRLMKAIESGLIAIDFDAYIRDTGTVRDHGTKFRIKPSDLKKLYDTHETII